MDAFTKGDIVLFPFPYTDLSDRKLRPCLVLSEEMGEDIMLCQVTSQRLRKRIEELFGEGKDFMGLRRMRLRRLERVQEQPLLIALAQNLKRLVRLRTLALGT